MTISAGLHPWSVLSTFVFELTSDEAISIISLTGMQIDWTLTGNDAYSDKMRKRAYRPRVDSAFSALDPSAKLRVAWVVSSEFLRRHPGKSGELRDRLAAIGWTVDGDGIRPGNSNVSELFFPRGSEHDAYVRIREIVRLARRSITVVDPYLDDSVLTLLASANSNLSIRLLGHKFPSDFSHEVDKFRLQYKPQEIEVRRTQEFHDRFVVVDSVQCFHIGASIKDAGRTAFMLSQVQDSENLRSLLDQVERSWGSAGPIK